MIISVEISDFAVDAIENEHESLETSCATANRAAWYAATSSCRVREGGHIQFSSLAQHLTQPALQRASCTAKELERMTKAHAVLKDQIQELKAELLADE